jgi:hypothetical protein
MKPRPRGPAAPVVVASAVVVLLAAALAGPALAAPLERANPFACLGEGESLVRGMSTAEIESEVEKRVANPPAEAEGRLEVARHHCVTAELMRRVGDFRSRDYYEKAIALAPEEPGFELWYGYYLRNVRGPRMPLLLSAEPHYFRGLDKLRALSPQDRRDFDEITQSWLQRGLINLYQDDGFPLLSSKAYPYRTNGTNALGAALTAMARVSRDTNEFLGVDDARRFAAEASFAGSVQRLRRPLDDQELATLVRTPLRHDLFTRLRLRVPVVGAFDFLYERFRAPESQIAAYTHPDRFVDVAVDQFGVGWRRSFDLGRLFDLVLDGQYRRVERTGVVEWFPELTERINLIELRPAVARFFGPDKVLAGMNYVYMQIPAVPFGPLEDRVRARVIRAFYVDYAFYRQLLLPDFSTWELRRMATRGFHVYGGYAADDEVFGVRQVWRRDSYGGVSLRGLGNFDVTLQGTVLASDTTWDQRDDSNAIVRVLDESQSIQQVRPTMVLLYRVVDEEAIPDVPKGLLAGLNVVVPLRADFATAGIDKFDNVRGGIELWSKLISTGLRGTNFLITAGYETQYFYRLSKLIHMGRLELRMGWGIL